MKLPLVTIPPLKHPQAASLAAPYICYNAGAPSAVLLVCDHASAAMPDEYDGLGVPQSDLARHIALDIGAARLTEALAQSLAAPAILAAFTRLLIDPNRGCDEETLIPKSSDGTPIPGNLALSAAERDRRIAHYHEPYHRAVGAMMEKLARGEAVPAFIGIHSFTPEMNGVARPWEVGILWNRDDRLARYMIDWLTEKTDFAVGANEPYSGAVAGYSMNRHGGWHGYPNAVVEIRQDLIDTPEGVADWAAILHLLVGDMLADLSPFARCPMS